MKKITFVLAAALVSLSTAAEINNPVGADGCRRACPQKTTRRKSIPV